MFCWRGPLTWLSVLESTGRNQRKTQPLLSGVFLGTGSQGIPSSSLPGSIVLDARSVGVAGARGGTACAPDRHSPARDLLKTELLAAVCSPAFVPTLTSWTRKLRTRETKSLSQFTQLLGARDTTKASCSQARVPLTSLSRLVNKPHGALAACANLSSVHCGSWGGRGRVPSVG